MCPTTPLVRTYTAPAFAYDVNVVASTVISADDNLQINNTDAGSTTPNNYCLTHNRANTTQPTMDSIPVGKTIRRVPAGTTIVITNLDAVGISTSAGGTLKFVPVSSNPSPTATYTCSSGYILNSTDNMCYPVTTSLVDIQSNTASVWDALLLFFGLK